MIKSRDASSPRPRRRPGQRELLCAVLESAGYAVDGAVDGQEGLRRQSARPADIVITDIFMPNSDGLETMTRLRAETQAKVVVISGGGTVVRSTNYPATVREIGAHAVLPKRFE